MLIVTPKGAEVRRWWSPPVAETSALSFDDAAVELRRLLEESVRLRFMSDVPFGAFLSGGVDSSIVCALMAKLMEQPVKTFTIGFQGAPEDETGFAREVARHIGAEHHEFVVEPDALAILPSLVWHLDEPLADTSVLPTWAVSEMARQHVTVTLSGDGGDETFAGYETYRLAQAYAGVDRLPAGLRQLAAGLGRGAPGRWGSRFERLAMDAVERHARVMAIADPAAYEPLLSDGVRSAVNGHDSIRALRGRAGAFAPGDLRALLHLDLTTYMTDDVLAKVDRMSMAHSLEVRPPFLDHRIVEFAATLPEHMKIRRGRLKFILRELMSDRLPPAVLTRRKEGFDIPVHHWLRTALRPLLKETLSEQNVRQSEIFSWNAIDTVMRVHLERRANLGYHLWGLLVLFLWMKRWGIGPPAQAEATLIPAIPAAATR
jgi:asparagine synthase (glutamine-hydrolysing)